MNNRLIRPTSPAAAEGVWAQQAANPDWTRTEKRIHAISAEQDGELFSELMARGSRRAPTQTGRRQSEKRLQRLLLSRQLRRSFYRIENGSDLPKVIGAFIINGLARFSTRRNGRCRKSGRGRPASPQPLPSLYRIENSFGLANENNAIIIKGLVL